MSLAALFAVRVQRTIDELAALKARPAAEVRAEARLRKRLEQLLGTIEDRVGSRLRSGRPPASAAAARGWLGDVTDLEDGLLELLTDEVGEEAGRAIGRVEAAVAAQAPAAKGLPELPFGMDRKLFTTLNGLRDRMLGRLLEGTVTALVNAAEIDMPVDALRELLHERLLGEINQLTRQAMGDARNEATVVAEQELGVRWHTWHTVGDDAVRSWHADVDGETVQVGEPFSNGSHRPGGLGCRCWLEPWFPAPGQAGP